MKKRLMLMLIVLLISISSARDYKKDYTKQVKVNIKQEKKIVKLEKKVISLEAKEDSDRIFLGLTKDKVNGTLAYLAMTKIHPALGVLYFFRKLYW